MIYTFKSKAAGDLIMTEPVADRLLKLIGKTLTPMGVIEPSAMPAAIAAIEAAIAQEEARPASAGAEPADDARDPLPEVRVTLRQRAFPLIQMMQQASVQQVPIVWGI
jgi:hypothetical protein